ncbi:zinc-finger domain of monoamine-oxidase A repressor R1-domain-containing protein [Dunaliella salina]|uniref:Zinc-finger domain of monoamine-oxidase A repressor R1-domain-containing protein n=1 Tax=Dunaliella salina TaxID=3046 RepID=A0ABQ7H4P2_DUNSA|nr:zinc-finger domain of monoamine-oxidase A repressor R1-domain-containing protein [Dunaliella salina]|eukprot:KAF5841753.1 zinc-finger domain of monoamine-oxidase A repressor R1-domain-containing protein [Dunaliella salina]
MRCSKELGVDAAARDLAQAAQSATGASGRAPSRPRQSRVVPASLHTERRRSSRTEGRAPVNYRDDAFFGDLYGDRPSRGSARTTPTLRALTQEEVEEIRAQHGVQALEAYEQGQAGASILSARWMESRTGTPRKPVDSGKGVRIQGGKVYDSKHGISCHWCRQKTLEDHVTCTHPNCGKGKKMPTTFCANCLRNRHGEDQQAAVESQQWVCPPCRGTCGPGCVCCCNCGPCRKKLNLEPTRQIVPYARSQGFSNVHDFLVHMVTGESFEAIQARKAQHPWGRWLAQEGNADTSSQGQPASSQGGQGEQQEHDGPQDQGTPAGDGAAAAADGGAQAATNGGAQAAADNEAPAAACKDGPVATAGTAGIGGGERAKAEEPCQDAGADVEDAAGSDSGAAAAGTDAPPRKQPGRKRGRSLAAASEALREVKPKRQAVKGSKRGAR